MAYTLWNLIYFLFLFSSQRKKRNKKYNLMQKCDKISFMCRITSDINFRLNDVLSANKMVSVVAHFYISIVGRNSFAFMLVIVHKERHSHFDGSKTNPVTLMCVPFTMEIAFVCRPTKKQTNFVTWWASHFRAKACVFFISTLA